MNKTIELFNELKSTTSSNDKIEIIKNNKDNDVFVECLKFLVDGNVTTGINKKKYDKIDVSCSDWTHHNLGNELIECLQYIKEHNTGRDEDVIQVKSWCNSFPEDMQDFVKGMITKSIKLGITSKSLNKAIPNSIDEWQVQLGSGFDKLKLKEDELIFVSQKMNGNRGSFYKGKLISRQGKEFKGLQHIIDDIHKLELDDWFIDGELIRKNVDHLSDNENFTIGTGILNSDAETKEEIGFIVFDMFPACELDDRKSKDKYQVRYKYMKDMDSKIRQLRLNNIRVVNFVYVGTDHSVLPQLLDNAVNNGWEGNMIAKNECYECKRTTNLIKQKRFYSFDLPIIDVLEGDGKLKGTMGSVVVKFKDNTVNVGSGFDDNTRKYFWDNKEELIGRVIEVKYKEISKDKNTGLESLQFPIYLGLREQGKEESYN